MARSTVTISQGSWLSRRTSAEPTMPRWPATQTRFPSSGKLGQRPSRAFPSAIAAMSSRTISAQSASKSVSCFQPSFSRAFDGSPTRMSTSVGRKIAGINLDKDAAGACVLPFFADALSVPGDLNSDFSERLLHEGADGVSLAGGEHIVVGLRLLQHQPHAAHIFARVAPVALGVEIAEIEPFLQSACDRGDGARDLAGDKGLAAERALVIEQDPVRGVHSVGFAIVHDRPVGEKFGDAVGAARVERRLLRLRNLLRLAVKLGRRRLIETRLLDEAEEADRLEQAKRAERVSVGGVFGRLEAHLHVALGGEVVNLVGLRLLHDADEVGRIRHVAEMQDELLVRLVRVLIEVLDAAGVEGGRAALQAVDGVALLKQELGEIGAVLSRRAGNEGHLADPGSIHETPRCF